MPVLLWDAFQQAITLEKIQMPMKTNTLMVNEISNEHNTVELDSEMEAVRAQLNQLISKN
jgi:hypothetical protein